MKRTEQAAWVATALLAGDRYGYEMIRKTKLPSGTLYPILRRFEQAGWVTSRWERPPEDRAPRRLYRLTARGKKSLPDMARRTVPL